MKPNRSIQKQLLQWLLIPLLGLIIVDSSFLYRIALHFQSKAYDHALLDTATDIGQLIKESKNPDKFIQLGPEARRMFLTDQYDQMYYNIYDTQGHFIGGDKIMAPAGNTAKLEKPTQFTSGIVNGKKVRIVVTRTTIDTPSGPLALRIQLAETLTKRDHLAKQILIGIVVPQLLLLVAAIGIVWFGIGRGLEPLWQLHASLAWRSHRDLNPVWLPNIPDEVQTLVNTVNLFMHKLQNVLASQNTFIANAAHQLRTPLAGMLAQLELAQNETDPDERQASLKRIGQGMEQLSHLVNQLLVLARNQPEVVHSIHTRRLDLNSLAQGVTMEMVPAAILRQVDLGFEGEQQELPVEGDPTRLNDLLYNLIDNAIRYSGAGSKVTVSAMREGQRAILRVEDNGPGIPPEEREKVFERFHRVIGSGQDGSGLGLAIVMEIAQIHSASVLLEDSKNGQGATFNVAFDLLPN